MSRRSRRTVPPAAGARPAAAPSGTRLAALLLAPLAALALAPLPAAAQADAAASSGSAGGVEGPAAELSEEVREFVSVDAPVVAITGVRLVDGTGAPAAEGRTVVIEDGRIRAVGPDGEVEIPAEAEVLERDGFTLIPGLVGLHDHTFYTTSARQVQLNFSGPRLYLAGGVTTVRTTGSYSPYSEIRLKRSIDRGEVPGPDMFVTGPYITGQEEGVGNMYVAETPEDARRVVSYWAEEGASWFKAYTRISRDALGAAIQEAHDHGLKFTAHLCSVTFSEAVDLGIDNLEHGYFTNTGWYPDKEPDECPEGFREHLAGLDVQGPEVGATIRKMVENDVAMTSTLAVYEMIVPGRPPLRQRTLNALAAGPRDEYLSTREEIASRAGDSFMPEVFRKAQAFEKRFHDMGGLLAAGVDPTGIGGALPGFGDQRNFELLVEGGFEPVEAIRVMTANGARVLGIHDEVGTVEAGKRADLVLIDGNPLEDAGEIRNVTTVFRNGVGYDSKELIASVRGVVGIR